MISSKFIPSAAACMLIAVGAQAQDAPTRSLTNVAGDVYRFQNNAHYGLAVVTDEGVVVMDTINADVTAWLEAELKTLTDRPVTHLIYSHSHGDHASGGASLVDTATVIAHANAPKAIDGVEPDIRFSQAMQLEHGGKTFELTYLGPGHGTDLIAVVVRPENVAFVVDAVSTKRLPYQDMTGADIDGIIDQISAVEALDFEALAPGHSTLGTKADATDARIYLERLRAEVLEGLAAGQKVDALVASITMDDYKDWAAYEQWRALNIQGMARFLQETGQVN